MLAEQYVTDVYEEAVMTMTAMNLLGINYTMTAVDTPQSVSEETNGYFDIDGSRVWTIRPLDK